jgi:hypothetical protein
MPQEEGGPNPSESLHCLKKLWKLGGSQSNFVAILPKSRSFFTFPPKLWPIQWESSMPLLVHIFSLPIEHSCRPGAFSPKNSCFSGLWFFQCFLPPIYAKDRRSKWEQLSLINSQEKPAKGEPEKSVQRRTNFPDNHFIQSKPIGKVGLKGAIQSSKPKSCWKIFFVLWTAWILNSLRACKSWTRGLSCVIWSVELLEFFSQLSPLNCSFIWTSGHRSPYNLNFSNCSPLILLWPSVSYELLVPQSIVAKCALKNLPHVYHWPGVARKAWLQTAIIPNTARTFWTFFHMVYCLN